MSWARIERGERLERCSNLIPGTHYVLDRERFACVDSTTVVILRHHLLCHSEKQSCEKLDCQSLFGFPYKLDKNLPAEMKWHVEKFEIQNSKYRANEIIRAWFLLQLIHKNSQHNSIHCSNHSDTFFSTTGTLFIHNTIVLPWKQLLTAELFTVALYVYQVSVWFFARVFVRTSITIDSLKQCVWRFQKLNFIRIRKA